MRALFVLFFAGSWSYKTYGLSQDFRTWLYNNGYANWIVAFARDELNGYGSFGGRRHHDESVRVAPVIFVHGNSDQALGNPGSTSIYQTGWNNSIEYFLLQGYSLAELYGTTWGPANPALALQQTHSCEYVLTLRRFFEAVLNYTGSSQIDIIAHSMGVTLAAKALRGGLLLQPDSTTCDVGPPLTAQIDTFVGIAGANKGLNTCQPPNAAMFPTCNQVNGFYPGTCATAICSNPYNLSVYMADLQNTTVRAANHIFSLWSYGDELLGNADMVWGAPTSSLPGQQGEQRFCTFTHMQTKERTAYQQHSAVRYHRLNSD